MKFLVDECFSPKRTELAHERGYGEASHVVWLGRSVTKDWDLLPLIMGGKPTCGAAASQKRQSGLVDVRAWRCAPLIVRQS